MGIHFDNNDVLDVWAAMTVPCHFTDCHLYVPDLDACRPNRRRVVFLRSHILNHGSEPFQILRNIDLFWFVVFAGIGTFVFDVRLVFVDVGVGVRCLVRFAFVSKLLNNGDGDVGIFWPCNVAHPWKLSVECGDVKYSCHALSPNANVSPPWLYVSAWQ